MHDRRTKHETTDNGQLNPKLNKKEKQEKHIRENRAKRNRWIKKQKKKKWRYCGTVNCKNENRKICVRYECMRVFKLDGCLDGWVSVAVYVVVVEWMKKKGAQEKGHHKKVRHNSSS